MAQSHHSLQLLGLMNRAENLDSSHGMFFFGACQQPRERKVGIKNIYSHFYEGNFADLHYPRSWMFILDIFEVFMMYANNVNHWV